MKNKERQEQTINKNWWILSLNSWNKYNPIIFFRKFANENFSFSLVSRSGIIVFQSGESASRPHKRWLSAYLSAHTCTALPPQSPYMQLLFQPMKRNRIEFQRALHFVGVMNEVGEAPASHWKRKSDEQWVLLPTPSILSIVSVKKWKNAALASSSHISKASVGRRVGVEGRKEGSAQEVWQNGHISTGNPHRRTPIYSYRAQSAIGLLHPSIKVRIHRSNNEKKDI